MAQVILSGIGRAFGGSVGAWIGGMVGAAADRTLVNSLGPARQVGTRLESVRLSGSAEGDPIKQVFGRARIAGTVIWAARLKENRSTTRASKTSPKTESFSYALSFALALGEGPIDGIGRVWADGQPFDLAGVAYRLYHGTEDQVPDALIAAIEGTAPGYRGLAYIVFEDLDITQFGNRPPNLSVEVFRRPRGPYSDLESQITAVCLIPGAGEFVYGTTAVHALSGLTRAKPQNSHTGGRTDFALALDQLVADLPNLTHVNLVVSWYGTSLDAGSCQVLPGVEAADKVTNVAWSVAGFERADAHVVSQIDGRPAYGGTPSDAVVLEAITALKARGYVVTLIPFILMDCTGFPWRGRITSAGDGTATAASDVAAFMNSGFGDFVRHMAAMGQAGGADAIVLGSELRGLTRLRDAGGNYPMVTALRTLAAEVRSRAPGLQIGYGADWTEYGAHVSGGDVIFHLDPLWSDANVDFVGIDWYAPLSDWRDGADHLDAAEASSIYDPAYLQSRIRAGEGFDWHYASDADRDAQVRTPIIDTAHAEDWVFRPKDLRGWWSSSHHNRPGGVRSAVATAWTPGMKPVRLIEIGCAAIDKGANAPNCFLDPKSSESAIPPYSSGDRDDRMQRAYLQAFHDFYAEPENNPGMLTDMAVWCYDARPYPWFPRLGEVWGDADNWRTGHWLNGRLGAGEARNLIADIAGQAGIGDSELDLDEVSGNLDGYVIEQPVRAADALTAVLTVLGLEAAERGGRLAFVAAGRPVDAELLRDELALSEEAKEDDSPLLTRRDLAEVPSSLMLRAYDPDRDYQVQAVHVRRDGVPGAGQLSVDLALSLGRAQVEALARDLLAQMAGVRETVTVAIDPLLALRHEAGDVVHFDGRDWRVTVVDLDEQPSLSLTPAPVARAAKAADPSKAGGVPGQSLPVMTGFILMDLPCFGVYEADARPVLIASSDPWVGVDVYAGASPLSLRLRGRVEQAAGIGRTLAALPSQRPHMLLEAASLDIYLEGEPPMSRSLEEVLAGANLVCVRGMNEEWELIQFLNATVLGVDCYRLSGLIRGQWGSEQALSAGIAADAEVVVLPAVVTRAQIGSDELGLDRLWRCGRIGFGGVAAGALDSRATWMGLGLRPRAPVFGRVTGTGDLTVSWLRAPRYGGDSWDAEPPLCEDYELYRVEVFDGTELKRSADVASTAWVYALADQAVDFPSGFSDDARIEVAQKSQTWGWGARLNVSLA